MKQLRVRKDDIRTTDLVDIPLPALDDGEVRVRIDRIGYSANNVTYAAAGDTLKYWQFFPTDDPAWGVVPVWGFADVEASRCEGMAVGDRLFGYFPTAEHLVMRPTNIAPRHFIDGASHRADLPAGYNIYRRVERGGADAEDRHMLLFPLYITSWALWDTLKMADWHGAERVLVISASSKTAIGLAFGLSLDDDAPTVTGLTSTGNRKFVHGLGLYDEVATYDALGALDASVPTVIVDMSGDATLLGELHLRLGDAMRHTHDVGLTHWDASRRDDAIIRERRSFFFAPSHIAARTRQWGPKIFGERTRAFLEAAVQDSRRWMAVERHDGLSALTAIHPQMAAGKSAPDTGVVIEP